MKFLHTADWHIGRKLNGFSLLEEQEAVFLEVMAIAKKEQVDAIVIAGDLYDRSIPSVEAVSLFNTMMVEMNLKSGYPVLAISGNHDSATRLETGSLWLKTQDFYLQTQLSQAFEPIEMLDTQFYLLPYFEPFHGRQYFQDDSLRDIQGSMKLVIEKMKESFNPKKNQVLVSHFFAAGSTKSESETTLEVGGLDSIPIEMLLDFDYVALGHLHYKNAITKNEKVQYSGALLKYSLSEEKQEKGVRIIELSEKKLTNTFIPIKPLRDVKKISGSFKELTEPDFYDSINREDYLAITLTDSAVIINAIHELRQIYPHLISLERVQSEQRRRESTKKETNFIQLKPDILLKTYYKEVTDKELTKRQSEWLEEAIIENRTEK
ncbi:MULTISPECIES: exonuclease SbcCD subunit D [Vagococcus]|uniref:Nuclease SbcCD subunit D n=1 Tax=Vagococcus fluvialis bH819 TaxID=1255619 RepID=A0A1X6WML3_9ENTE|nr:MULTISPECIES: exonuclease SbcCD subunit D [Vagococcus]SLM85505.1 Exonuclease SbcD [Vagococcus fluvialis bH819]HCM89472.1 exonuclease SbcCD subunit D [Vagococcus sp.]